MTEPERSYRCSVCGRWHLPGACSERVPPYHSVLAVAYAELRMQCIQVEEVIAAVEADPGAFTGEDLKRLDKAVTVMKVGFKIVKKVLAKQGFKGLKKQAIAAAAGDLHG